MQPTVVTIRVRRYVLGGQVSHKTIILAILGRIGAAARWDRSESVRGHVGAGRVLRISAHILLRMIRQWSAPAGGALKAGLVDRKEPGVLLQVWVQPL